MASTSALRCRAARRRVRIRLRRNEIRNMQLVHATQTQISIAAAQVWDGSGTTANGKKLVYQCVQRVLKYK